MLIAADLITLRIRDACRISGISRSALYEHIGAGRITAKKSGAATLVDAASLRAFLESLPPAPIAPRYRRTVKAPAQ
jgi:hypothetical protein